MFSRKAWTGPDFRTLEVVKKGPIGWAISIWRFVRDVALRWYNERIGDLAASVTFWIVVSLPASILALLAALGPIDSFLGEGIDLKEAINERVGAFIDRVFTDESDAVAEAVEGLFDRSSGSLAAVSLGITIWSLSRGFSGLIRALEDIYDIEDRRPWYHTRFVAVVLGFGSMFISVPLVLAEQFIWNQIPDGPIERVLRTIVAVVILVLWASIVLHYGPAKRHKWSFDLPGAVVVAVLWWLLTIGFGYYIGFDFSDEIQSAVGTFLLALTWVWMAAQMLLIGGAVNYLFGERLGVSRNRRPWKINDVVSKSTGEIKKIVVPNGKGDETESESASESASETQNKKQIAGVDGPEALEDRTQNTEAPAPNEAPDPLSRPSGAPPETKPVTRPEAVNKQQAPIKPETTIKGEAGSPKVEVDPTKIMPTFDVEAKADPRTPLPRSK